MVQTGVRKDPQGAATCTSTSIKYGIPSYVIIVKNEGAATAAINWLPVRRFETLETVSAQCQVQKSLFTCKIARYTSARLPAGQLA